jgi:hypothetical protein
MITVEKMPFLKAAAIFQSAPIEPSLINAGLICGGQTFLVPVRALMATCHLFRNTPSLVRTPYSVVSHVSIDVFRQFLSAIQDDHVLLTTENDSELFQLCEEFDFKSLHARVLRFRETVNSSAYMDPGARNSILLHESRILFRLHPSIDRVLSEFPSVYDSVNRTLIPTVAWLRDGSTRFLSATNTRLTAQTDGLNSAVQIQKRELAELLTELADLAKSQNDADARHRSEILSLSTEAAEMQAMLKAVSRPLDSVIIECVPGILSAFAGKNWKLLYRGGRDGFGAKAFHAGCDSRPNTVTVIVTPESWIFGGFTPLAWRSLQKPIPFCDDSLQSFVFTLTNPHGTEAMKFMLRDGWTARSHFGHLICRFTFALSIYFHTLGI